MNRGEVYAGGRHLATYTAGTTYFDHGDWIGTERARSGVSGTVCETVASLPFGDGQVTTGGCGDPSPLHFTGKQRDTETNLDDFDARYYSSTMGRFISADWSAVPEPVPYAHLSNPETLNLYAIVSDNVESFADLDGHDYDIQGCCTVGTYVQVLQMVALQMPGAKVTGDQTRGEITLDGANVGSYEYCDPGKCTQKAATKEQLDKAAAAAQLQNTTTLDKDKVAEYMDKHANGTGKYGGLCATACRKGLEAGGLNTIGHPEEAKDYGPFLTKHGARAVSRDGYKPEKGDVAVFQGGGRHTSGHIEIYDGKQWVSDTKQPRFEPSRNYPGGYVVYRFPK